MLPIQMRATFEAECCRLGVVPRRQHRGMPAHEDDQVLGLDQQCAWRKVHGKREPIRQGAGPFRQGLTSPSAAVLPPLAQRYSCQQLCSRASSSHSNCSIVSLEMAHLPTNPFCDTTRMGMDSYSQCTA